MLGFIRRSTFDIQGLLVRRSLYSALVRSPLAYCSQVWSPQTVALLYSLERIQHRATKLILSLPFRTEISYKIRLLRLGLVPLCYWHEYLDLVYLLKSIASDPYISVNIPLRTTRRIHNWIVNFLKGRQQRVVVDGISTSYLSINRGIPQGTVIGPILFSILINDIKAVNPSSNLLVKYANDISLSIPVGAKLSQAESEIEVKSIMEWAKNNRLSLNLGKTWEMLMKGKKEKDQPDPLQYIKRKSNLKLLGVTFEDNPTNWDTHFDYLLSKASSRLYILRVCKHYGFSVDYLDLLFKSLILSIFTYAIEVWGGAFYNKYLSRIDNSF